MVRGLVEHEQVVAARDQARDHRARPLAAREFAQHLLLLAAAEQERARHVARLLLGELGAARTRRDGALQVLPDGERAVEVLVRLTEPARVHLGTALDGAAVGLELAQQRADERGLAGAVGADHADAVAGRDEEVEGAEELALAELLGDLLGHEHRVAHARTARQADLHRVELDRTLHQLVALEALEARGTAAGLLGALARLVAQDVALLAADAVELLLVHAHLGEVALGAKRHERLVVARIAAHLAFVDLLDAVHHAVEQATVVADDHHRALEGLGQEGLEPLAALDVEVVRGLVEHDHVGVLQQQARQAESRLLSAAQARDRDVELRVLEAETMQHGVDQMVVAPAAAALDRLLELDLTVHESLQLGALGGGHRLEHLVELGLRAVGLGHRLGGGGAQRVAGVEAVLLRHVPQADPALHADIARVELGRAAEDLEQGGLAAAVAADQAHALTRLDREGGAVEHLLRSQGDADVGGRDDGHGAEAGVDPA